MSGPVFGERSALPFDDLLRNSKGWDDLNELLPQLAEAPLRPSDTVAKNMANLARTKGGRDMLEWIMDITLRAPYHVTGKTIEETALNSATRQGINGVAEAILNAIKHGEDLLEKGK